jgi:hypothetical protein
MVGSRGVLMRLGVVGMFCVVRVPLLMPRYDIVLMNRTDMDGTGSFQILTTANALHAANSDAHEPQQRARSRENAEQGTNFRLPRKFHLQLLTNLAIGHIFRFQFALGVRLTAGLRNRCHRDLHGCQVLHYAAGNGFAIGGYPPGGFTPLPS